MAKGKQGPNPNRLTAKDFKFAQLVIGGMRPEDAAVECGHSSRGSAPRVAAMRMMDKPSIKNYIQNEQMRRIEQIRKEVEVDDIWITKKLKEIVDRCMTPEPVMRFDREAGEMVQARDEATGQLLFSFDAMGAIKAVENLAKHIGYFEKDNSQKKTVIQVGVVNQQNILNFFSEEPQEEQAANAISNGPED
jgi:phage terminase small subunit